MAKATKQTDTEKVTAHIQALDKSIPAAIEYIRQLILGADKEIAE